MLRAHTTLTASPFVTRLAEVPPVADDSRQSDDTPHRIDQSIFKGAHAESIHTGPNTQTFHLPQPRPKPTGIPHNIPFRGSSIFVGRQAVLETLHQELTLTDR